MLLQKYTKSISFYIIPLVSEMYYLYLDKDIYHYNILKDFHSGLNKGLFRKKSDPCLVFWWWVLQSSSQIVWLELPGLPQILAEKKATCKATSSPNRDLDSWILVLGDANEEKLETSIYKNVSYWRKLEELNIWKGTNNLDKVIGSSLIYRTISKSSPKKDVFQITHGFLLKHKISLYSQYPHFKKDLFI